MIWISKYSQCLAEQNSAVSAGLGLPPHSYVYDPQPNPIALYFVHGPTLFQHYVLFSHFCAGWCLASCWHRNCIIRIFSVRFLCACTIKNLVPPFASNVNKRMKTNDTGMNLAFRTGWSAAFTGSADGSYCCCSSLKNVHFDSRYDTKKDKMIQCSPLAHENV